MKEIKVRVDDLKQIFPSEDLIRRHMRSLEEGGWTKTSRRLIVSWNRIKRKLFASEGVEE